MEASATRPPSALMQHALALAARHDPRPNPPVGALVTRNGRILGEGSHTAPGSPHAEAMAIQDALARGHSLRGASLWVTLEPCCHEGGGKRTPPCVPRVIASGIREVHCALEDPDPRVSGRGIQALRDAGLTVQVGEGARESAALLRAFGVNRLHRRAMVTLKWAQTLDGRLAPSRGSERWISSPASRRDVHVLRAASDAVLAGAATATADNPRLDARREEARQPRPVLVLGRRPLSADLHLVRDQAARAPLFIHNLRLDPRGEALRGLRNDLVLPWDGDDWNGLWESMYRIGLGSVLVEGGPRILGSILDGGAWDRMIAWISPRITGGGPSIPRGPDGCGIPLDQAFLPGQPRWHHNGDDLVLEADRDPDWVENLRHLARSRGPLGARPGDPAAKGCISPEPKEEPHVHGTC